MLAGIIRLSRTACRKVLRLSVVGLVLAALSSCSSVSSKRDSNAISEEGVRSARELGETANLLQLPVAVVAGVAQSAEALIESGERLQRRGDPAHAAGNFLKAAVDARDLYLSSGARADSEATEALLNLYNLSLAEFAEAWSLDPNRDKTTRYVVSGEGEHFEVVLDPRSDYRADFFDEAVAADSVRGKGVVPIERRGYGAALVGIRHQTPERASELRRFHPEGMHIPITLTITDIEKISRDDGEHTRVSVAVLNSARHETIRVGGRSLPLAADFSAPLLLMLDGQSEILGGLFGFLNARKRSEEAGIFLMEPYDPNRIPVVLTHGLISVPIIWRDIIPELLSEPDIARRFQIFVFTYPSSYAIVESAELFRDELEAIRKEYDGDRNDPLSRNMVAMGHSMGGILTHMLVTDFDDRIWNQVSDQPFDQFPFKAGKKEVYRSLLFFDYDPAVQRAVFMSTPHRGADLATLNVASAFSRFAKLPSSMVMGTSDMLRGPPPPGLKIDIQKKVTSIQSLRPDAPVLMAMNEAPFKPGVVYHSIIGDRGKGDSPDSSDGIVQYWSSHLDGAASELIVPTGHSSYEHENAIAELKRILRLHAGL